jgi:hypothetical protein
MVAIGMPGLVLAQVAVAPTAEEAEQAFRAAHEHYVSAAGGGFGVAISATAVPVSVTRVVIPGGKPMNIDLSEVRLVLDVDDKPLKDVVADVIRQAAQYTGPWEVKWRLAPDNAELMNERVNLTAESNFEEFFGLLAERVKNLTGVQLFITVFDASRVILLSDTYY